MDTLNIRHLASGLRYISSATGLRQTYSVFQSRRDDLVLSFSRTEPNSGNFTLVNSDAVQCVQRKFGETQDITSTELRKRALQQKPTKGTLDALNNLDVLVAAKKRPR